MNAEVNNMNVNSITANNVNSMNNMNAAIGSVNAMSGMNAAMGNMNAMSGMNAAMNNMNNLNARNMNIGMNMRDTRNIIIGDKKMKKIEFIREEPEQKNYLKV